MWHVGHQACIGLCYKFPNQIRGLFILASCSLLHAVFTHTLVFFVKELQLFLLKVGKDFEGNDEGDYGHDPRTVTLFRLIPPSGEHQVEHSLQPLLRLVPQGQEILLPELVGEFLELFVIHRRYLTLI